VVSVFLYGNTQYPVVVLGRFVTIHSQTGGRQITRLFLPSYSSLHEYVVRELGYSDGAAHRRITAMRAIREIPEIESKLSSGALNLTTVSQVQDFLKVEKRVLGKTVSLDEKRKIFDQIEGKSSRETERILAVRTPEVAAIRTERLRFVDDSTQQVLIRISPELTRKREWLKNRMAHSNPSPSLVEQLEALADLAIRRLGGMESASTGVNVAEGKETAEREELGVPEAREELKKCGKPKESVNSKDRGVHVDLILSAATSLRQTSLFELRTSRNRYVPASLRREVWRRAGGQCEFRVGADKTRCTRRHQLQVDHRLPVAWGGRSELGNLQLLCSAHNRWKSDRLG